MFKTIINNQWGGIDTRQLGRRINQVPGGRPPPHMRPPPPGRLPRPLSPPTALLDQMGNKIVGRDLVSFVGESIDVPVLVDGQVVVKWLLGLRRY